MPGFGDFSYTEVNHLHVLAGAYVETPAHYAVYENSYLISDVPMEKLVNLNCVVLHVKLTMMPTKPDNTCAVPCRAFIQVDD